MLEGLDGSGKSTLAAQLSAKRGAALWSTPTKALRQVRDRIDASLVFDPWAGPLFYAAAVLSASAQIDAVLAAGRDVVCDRYWLTTLVYAELAGVDLRLPDVEQRLCPADCTLFVHVEHPERVRRLRARGMSAADAQTLCPRRADALTASYLRRHDHPVAGQLVPIDLTGCGPARAAERCSALLDQVCESLL